VTRRVQRLSLHLHLEEVVSRSVRRRRRILGMHQVTHPLFVISIGRKAIALSTIGTQRLFSFYGKKGHLEESCWEKQATCHQARLISEEEWKEDFPNPTMNSKAHGEEEYVK
jgi:hypothetical protein